MEAVDYLKEWGREEWNGINEEPGINSGIKESTFWANMSHELRTINERWWA